MQEEQAAINSLEKLENEIGTQHVEYEKRQVESPELLEAAYVLGDGTTIPIDPSNPEGAKTQLKGSIMLELPEEWLPGGHSDAIAGIYGEPVDRTTFANMKRLPAYSGRMYPGSGVSYMDPLGMMNPAAMPPMTKHFFR